MAGQDITLTGFELIERLGVGGMGIVWKARQLSLDRLVAIKLVRPESIRSPEDVKQILQEARTAAKLKHPGIVQVYDACEQNGSYFLVMEFVDGYTIASWLARRKQLSVKDVLLIGESVATALEYAWQTAGLTHCDIKPENVMVDQDGTIKVADLGLSLTKDSKANEHEDEITGTPGYMSPEQVRGGEPLDCRTDIYSLGAMMYELLTGRRPFQDKTDAEAMECQLTETIVDPREIVSTIPLAVCMLLERMLVKDREGRYPSWTKVLTDIRKVTKGVFPMGPAPVAGASTLTLRKPAQGEPVKSALPMTPKRGMNTSARVLLLVFLLIAAYGGYRLWKTTSCAESGAVESPVSEFKGGTEAEREAEAGQWLGRARKWSEAHPASYDQAINRFRGVKEMFPGTAAAKAALEELEQVYLRRERAQQAAWESIQRKSEALVQEKNIKGALAFVEQYAGAFAVETESNRLVLAQGLRQQLAGQAIYRVEDEAWRRFVERLSGGIIAGKLQAALEALAEVTHAGRFPQHGAVAAELETVLKDARLASSRVLDSFRGEVGKTLVLRMGRGEMRVLVTAIGDQKVVATMADVGSQIAFNPDDLPVEERLRRMGTADTEGAALAKGIVAVSGRAYAEAEALFAKTGPILSEPLLAKLQEVKSARSDEEVLTGLRRVLRSVGIGAGDYDETEWVRAVDQVRLTRDQAVALDEQREKFLVEFGMSDFAVRAAPVLLALERRCVMVMEGSAEAAAAAVPSPVAVPAPVTPRKVDIGTVLATFRTQNPGVMESQVSVYPMNGGTGIRVVSDSVMELKALSESGLIQGLCLETVRAQNVKLDLQPLSNAGLKELRLNGYYPADMNALKGMPLRSLTLNGVAVPSFAALEGLPLVELDLTGSSIRDLNPLRGMRLESLNLNGTRIASLMMLAGMPLKTLSGRGIPVRDISALRGLPLETLDLSETSVMDFSVLRGMPLRSLTLSKTSVKDIGFCATMPLESLDIGDTAVADVSSLRGKTMRRLILARTGVKDITPLAGSSIETLDLSGTKIPFISLPQVLAKVQFSDIALDNVELTRIDFLRGKDLRRVSLAGTKVTDLSPLTDMRLRMLNVKGLRIDNASVLGTLKMLEDLWCDLDPLQERVLLADLPGLKRVNGVRRPDARF